MSVRRTLNARTHTIPSNAVWLEFERSDGTSKQWPKNTSQEVDREGHVNFMRTMGIDESIAVLWRKTVGKWVAQKMGKPQGPEYVLKSWPEHYQLYDHNKGPATNPRHDPYLYGSSNTLRFRSANEFAPHAYWLLTDATMNTATCECKYCSKKPQREVTQQLGLSKRSSVEPSPSAPRKRLREAREPPFKAPHAGIRRAPKPRPRATSRLTGPPQWEVVEKSNDVRDALGRRDVKAVRYFRRGEVIWCAINPHIYAPGVPEGISFWPGLVDVTTTKPEIQPLGTTADSTTTTNPNVPTMDTEVSIAPSASRPASPSPSAPAANITWSVRQHTSYKVKLLATSHSVTLSEDDVLPYLAYVPTEQLMTLLKSELAEALLSAEPEGSEPKMFDFDPYAPAEDLTRLKHSIAPYTLAIQIASKMARYWTPTDEWEAKFFPQSSLPPSPTKGTTPPQPDEPQPSLHDILTSTYAQNALPSASAGPSSQPDDVSRRMLGTHARAEPGPEQAGLPQLRYQGLWWGAERIWTDELVRLKLARCQFAPRGGEAVSPVTGPSQATLKWNAENNIELDQNIAGSGQKSLFMQLEGLFVVDVPSSDDPNVFVKEPRASGMLFELVEVDWKEEYPESAQAKGKLREDALRIYDDAPKVDPLLAKAEGASNSGAMQGVAAGKPPQEPTMNSQLSHSTASTPYPLPDPPKGYKFHPILAPGHEVVVSLSLISGRYYPGLLDHPYFQPFLQQARVLRDEDSEEGLYSYKQLWALEGFLPGMHQSMDPQYWKGGRHIMLKDAVMEARQELNEKREEVKNNLESQLAGAPMQPAASQEDVVMTDMPGEDHTNVTAPAAVPPSSSISVVM